ncbi:MAG: hypothetical protein K2Q09_05080 [Phycisphaerales bacterium]|nr:hypothetical protein [Phycisphaerales bacterium]
MEAPFSIEQAKRALRAWRAARVALRWVFAAVAVGLVSAYARTNVWVVASLLAASGAVALRVIRRHGPRRWRWVGHVRPDPRLNPPVSERFELDVPCERCGAANVGIEAAEWRGEGGKIQVFRTCGRCGHTQWWGDPLPPRVRLRERRREVSKACGGCGYVLEGIPLKRVDHEAGADVYTRLCPECGGSQFYRFPAGVPAPAAERSASELSG